MAKSVKAAAETKDQPTAEAGHNGPSDDEIRIAVNSMVKLNEERAQLNAKINGYRKGLRAQGFVLGKLDDRIKQLEWTPEEIKADEAVSKRYAEALRFPVGTQLEMFGTEATPDPVKEQLKWRNVGYKNGVAGKGWADEAPEECPPECVKEYGLGHEEGSEVVRQAYLRRAGVKPAAEPTAAATADEQTQEAVAA